MANIIIGRKTSIGPFVDADDATEPAPLEDRDDDAVGRADREQVHDRGLDGDDDRAEDGGQEQEADPDDAGEEQRHALADAIGGIDVRGGGARNPVVGAAASNAASTSSRRLVDEVRGGVGLGLGGRA